MALLCQIIRPLPNPLMEVNSDTPRVLQAEIEIVKPMTNTLPGSFNSKNNTAW
jgi:hypothetical protein